MPSKIKKRDRPKGYGNTVIGLERFFVKIIVINTLRIK